MAWGDHKGSLTASVASVTNPTNLSGSVSVAVGDLIFGVFAQQTALTATGTVTDNLGNTYAYVNAGTDGGVETIRCFWARVTVAGTLTQISVPATASANDASAVASVIEGPFATSPLDANPANLTDVDNDTPYPCPATGVLAQADEVVMAAIAIAVNTAVAATAPGSITQTVARANISCGVQRRVVSATTSVTPEFTGAKGDSTTTTASFKKASGTFGDGALSSAGVGAVSGVGKADFSAVLSSAGVATLAGTGKSDAAAAISAAGVGALTGVGKSDVSSVLATAGVADFSAVGAASGTISAVFSAAGASTVAAEGKSDAGGALSGAGLGAFDAVGVAGVFIDAVLAAVGQAAMALVGDFASLPRTVLALRVRSLQSVGKRPPFGVDKLVIKDKNPLLQAARSSGERSQVGGRQFSEETALDTLAPAGED